MAANETKVILTAEDKTAAAFASAKAGIERFSSAYSSLSSLVGIGAAGGLAATIKSTINFADEMNDLSQKVGIGVKNLATWKLAADQSGTSMDAVAKGVKGLSQYMVANGEALRVAGITAKDANGALIQLSDIFQAMPDGVEKTALAVQIFGKSGMDMIPMLNLGSKGLGEAQQKAEEYGRRLEELAPDADRFNDQLSELSLQAHAASINLATLVTGPMANWLEANNEAMKIAGSFGEMLRLFVFNLDAMTTEKPVEEIKRLTKALEDYQEASALGKFMQSPTGYLFGGRESDLAKQIAFTKYLQRQDVMAGAAKLGDYRDARDLSLAGASTMSRAQAMAAAAALRDKAGAASGAGKASRPFDPEGDFDFKFSEMNRKARREGFDARDKAVDEEAKAIEKLRQKYIDLADPFQKYRDQLNEINSLREKGLLTADQALEAEWSINEAWDKSRGALEDLGKTGKDTFADLTNAVESWGNRAADTFADFVVDGKASFGDLVNSMLKDIVRLQAKQVLDPITKGANSFLSEIVGNFFKPTTASANGNAFDSSGVIPFALGGIVNRPTVFPFAKGIGLMGEAGPEAILPLARGPNGKLGVQGGAGGGITVNLIENGSKAGQVEQRQSGGQSVVDIFVAQIRSAIAGDITRGSGPIPAALAGTYGLNRAAGGF